MEIYHERLEDIELDRESVGRETSIPRLRAWGEHLHMQNQEIGIMIRTMRESGMDTCRAATKLGYIRTALAWINRRLDALGHVEVDTYGPMPQKYRSLKAHLEKVQREMKAKNEALKAENHRLRMELDAIRKAPNQNPIKEK